MQTITFLEISSWIISQCSAQVKDFLLMGHVFIDHLRETPDKPLIQPLQVTHELAVIREKWYANSLAVEVLKAFDLSALLDEFFAVRLAELLMSGGELRRMRGEHETILDEISKVTRQWRVFTGCQVPLKELLVPSEVLKEQPYDELLTIELRYIEDVNPQAKTIADLLSNAIKLYEAVSRAGGYQDYPPLVVAYVNSGSTIRLDLKGLGAPIKEIKRFFVDVWNLIRHRKADDFHRKGKSIIEGLDILERIDKTKRASAITDEEANRLKLQINRAMLGLFEAGALTREVPDFEVVPNRELIKGIQQKLLPPASSSDHQDHTSQESTHQPRKPGKQRKRRRSPKKSESTDVEPSRDGE